MKILQLIFMLPPIEKRKMSQGILRRIFLPHDFTVSRDDTYIYYLCSRACFFLTSFLLALNHISLVLQTHINLYLFDISLPEDNFIEALANSFPFYTSTILLCTIIPFYLIKFRYNINPKKEDILWWHPRFQRNNKKTRLRVLFVAMIIILVSTVGLYAAFGLPLFIMSYTAFGDLNSSYLFLIFTSVLYDAFYSCLPMYAIFGFMALYKYIGPYQRRLNN